MRRAAAALALALSLAAPAQTLADSLAVNIDQAARITLGRPAHDIIVGNPMIADVNLLDSRHLVLMGKSYGVTNIMVIDAAGRTVFNRQVVVSAPDLNRVSLYRGPDVYNLACSPRCERTPMPGERDSGGPYSAWASPAANYAGRSKAGQDAAAGSQTAP